MTSRVDAPSGAQARSVATAPRVAMTPSAASAFAPAWSRARKRGGEPSRDAARTAQRAALQSGDRRPAQAAPPAVAAASSTALAPTPAPASRHAPLRNCTDCGSNALVAPNASSKAVLRRAGDAHAAITMSADGTTTIEPGWRGVRLVLRWVRSSWRLDWIGPQPSAVVARSLRALLRRLRGVLRGASAGWLR
jgi:hypothetical protein